MLFRSNYFDVKYSRFYNDTALYRYVIFSTKEKKEKDFLYVKKLSSKPLFIDYFDTGLQKFQSYESFYNLGFYSFYRLHYEVGLQNKKGFYILSNEEEKVEYYFYVNDKMYFSLNDDDLLKNSVFIDSTGNKKQDTIEISPDEADHDKYYTDIDLLLEKCQKFIDDLKETSRVFNRCFDVIFQGLPTIVQTFLICLYIIFLSILAFKLGGWSP